jgi:hypothetical protein
VASDQQKIEQAKLVFQNAFTVPGHNKYEATLALYEAMNVPNIERFLPRPQQQDPKTGQMVPAADFPPMPNPKVMEQQRKDRELQLKVSDQQFNQNQAKIELQMDVFRLQGEIEEMQAKAAKYRAEAGGVSRGHDIALLEASIGAKKAHLDGLLKAIEIMQKGKQDGVEQRGMGGVEAGPANPGVSQATRGNGAGYAGPMA